MILAVPREFSASGREMRKAKFKFTKPDENPVFFNLNTYLGFTNDTIIGGYKFTLKNLTPYPQELLNLLCTIFI